MKTKEELNALKEEVEALNRKLRELTDEELEQVVGGDIRTVQAPPPDTGFRVVYSLDNIKKDGNIDPYKAPHMHSIR